MTAVNSALSGGSISSETASAASSALEGITSKGDVSDAGVLSASGDLAVDAGSDSTKVTVVNQPPGLLTSNNIIQLTQALPDRTPTLEDRLLMILAFLLVELLAVG